MNERETWESKIILAKAEISKVRKDVGLRSCMPIQVTLCEDCLRSEGGFDESKNHWMSKKGLSVQMYELAFWLEVPEEYDGLPISVRRRGVIASPVADSLVEVVEWAIVD